MSNNIHFKVNYMILGIRIFIKVKAMTKYGIN